MHCAARRITDRALGWFDIHGKRRNIINYWTELVIAKDEVGSCK